MKLGIIRCMQTEDYCPGTADFKAVREKTGWGRNRDHRFYKLRRLPR